jgi:L-amino acid N-acyltransferase
MKDISIRKAVEKDLVAINDIYNFYVAQSTCTFHAEPITAEERLRWFLEHQAPFAVTVAEADGKAVGWGALSSFRPRIGYRYTVESSVYVRQDHQRHGIGLALLTDLIQRAKSGSFHVIVAGISADQEPSIKLHKKLGFVPAAHLREVGFKFDRWLDVVYMQLMLGNDEKNEQ